MIDKNIISQLLNDLENDRVERTTSTTNTDKFGQAICAFANDLPAYDLPGYLILGADDDGNLKPIDITDDLLKNLAAIRTDGNIQPQPSLVVEKVSLDEGDVVVVEVQPAIFPPVKYKGRIWIRVGPRKGVANDADEKILYEKRAANIRTFDAMPCIGTTVEDLDLSIFKLQYLPKAVPEDVIKSDTRDIRYQLQSLGFYDMRFDCPTYAGILLFGKDVERYLPGAYVQYVRFEGKGRAGKIVNEYKFAGNLCTMLQQLDTFVDTTITNRRPVPVTTLREEIVIDYPHWATRELLMNAICHRDYESNGPIQFYQYDDRIEILNPGGLYGKANPQNFPYVNDYRNSTVAEALKVLGFVNRFSRGVIRVKEELQENGNGDPQFSLDLVTAFLVVESISSKVLSLKYEDKKDRSEDRNEYERNTKTSDSKTDRSIHLHDGDKNEDVNEDVKLGLNHRNVYNAIKYNSSINYVQLMDNLGLSKSTIYRILSELKRYNYISRKGGDRKGEWIILKELNHK